MNNVSKYVQLPVKSDEFGCYIFDEDSKMILDSVCEHLSDSAQVKVLNAFAQAFNEAYGYKSEGVECSNDEIKKYITLPVVCDGEGNLIFDSKGWGIVRIRGWGYLQKEGEEKAVKIQTKIGDMFAEAFNKKYPLMRD